MWNEFLPILMPITAAKCRVFCHMAFSPCLRVPLPAFAGRAGARPDHSFSGLQGEPTCCADMESCVLHLGDRFLREILYVEGETHSRFGECWSFFDEEVSAGCGRSCCTWDGGARL